MSRVELMQQLVETEDKMERLAILEANPELMEEPQEPTEPDAEQVDYKAKYEEMEAKYIARFFGKPIDEEPVEPETKPLTVDDLKFD